MSLEAIGHQIYPIPPEVDATDLDQLALYIKSAPIGALVFVLLAQSAGSVVGGSVCGFLGRGSSMILSLIYGVLALCMASLNLILIPHPIWMVVLSLVLPIPLAVSAGVVASRLVSKPSDAIRLEP